MLSCFLLDFALQLQNVEVCGGRIVHITSSSTQPLDLELERCYGLKLYPQKGCLPAGVDKVTITILVSTAGQYIFPDNCHLVSSVVWLRCLPNCAFTKPIKFQMEHCANTSDFTKLIFVRASTSSLPYSFKQLEGGQFFTKDHNNYGTIELSRFCGMGMCLEGSSAERIYYASLLYLGQQTVPNDIHVAMTWNVPGHITVSLHKILMNFNINFGVLYNRNSRMNMKMLEKLQMKKLHLRLNQTLLPWTFQ